LKTLAEIAIEAGLVTKTGVAKAGRLADQRDQPLVAVMVHDLGIDEVALAGALRKQTRVPLIDPAGVEPELDALRLVSRDTCIRLRVLPLSVTTDGKTKVLRVAMADPTDTSAILRLEQLVQGEIEVSALPLSAIEELLDRGYRQVSTAIVNRPRSSTRSARTKVNRMVEGVGDAEASVTAQIPLATLVPADDDLERRFLALCQVLQDKGLVSEAELAAALRALDAKGSSDS
jgi:hypothetical protein